MKIIAIAAVARNGVIGKGSQLPWNIPEDLRFFRDSTKGQFVVMGRKTFEALGKPLPNRINAVITRDEKWSCEGVLRFSDLESAILHFQSISKPDRNLFVIGGAEIYRLAFSFIDELWLTEIDADFEGDVYFPEFRGGKLSRPEFELRSKTPQKDESPSRERYFFCRYGRSTRK